MKSKKLTLGLLIFYLVALTWIIVLKMQFPFSGNLPELRNINLIPFGGSLIVNGEVSFSEIIKNVLVFIPFGILISLLWERKSFVQKILPIVLRQHRIIADEDRRRTVAEQKSHSTSAYPL